MKQYNVKKRFGIIFCVCFAIYVLAGFFIVPPILKYQIKKQVHAFTNRTVTLGNVSFNPLALSLTLRDFSILGKKGENFLSWRELYVNCQASSLITFTVTFDEIRLVKPGIYLERLTPDEFNFSDLLPDETTEGEENNKSGNDENKIIPLRIGKLILAEGLLHIRDSSRAKPADFNLAAISFQLDDFSTKLNPDETNAYDFKATGTRGGFLHWNGNFSLAPLASQGLIELSGIDLASVFVFYQDQLNFALPAGKFGFKTEYRFAGEPEIQIELKKGYYTISDFMLTEKDSGRTILALPDLSVNDVSLITAERKIATGDITVNGGEFRAEINKEGKNSIVTAMDLSGLDMADDTGKASDIPDDKPGTNPPDQAPDTGASDEWTCDVSKFDLKDFSVNFSDNSAKKPMSVSLDPLNILVDKISVSSGNTSDENGAPGISINRILVADPALNVQINEEQEVAVQEPEKDVPAATPAAPADKSSETKPVIDIGEFALENGKLNFKDLSPSPDFSTDISQISGSITGISSMPGKISDIAFNCKINRHAPVTIKGKSNLLSDAPNCDVTVLLKNMELSAFTPYSGTYAGYKIARGQLSFDQKYLLKDSMLHGKNKIIVNKLEFGEKVESDQAVHLPLKLAVALLSDTNGLIDLNVDVDGDVNDPGFSIAGLILKVLKNIIVKTASSPFNMLAGIVGGGDDLDFISFTHGSAEPDDTAKEKLLKLSTALKDRPQLIINIKGKTDYASDLAALKRIHLNEALKSVSGIDTEAAGGVETAEQNNSWRGALFDMYKQSSGETWRNVRDMLNEGAKTRGEEPDTETILTRTVNHIYDYLTAKQPVTDENLYALAGARAQAVKSNLAEQNGIDSGRVFVLDPDVDPSHVSSGVELTLDAR